MTWNAEDTATICRERCGGMGYLSANRFGDIIGSCDALTKVFHTVEKVATAEVSVLITGETGTGKELFAREIHRRSPRGGGPFIVINCGAIPENLMESELFGHVRGAFTGAVTTRAGKFQLAHRGSAFNIYQNHASNGGISSTYAYSSCSRRRSCWARV